MPTANFIYTFQVHDRDGSRLVDLGLTRDGTKVDRSTPKMHTGDTLQVQISWPGASGERTPAELTGHFMISAAPARQDQLSPSPFRNGDRYLCYQKQTASASSQGSDIGYLFPGLACVNAADGQYELTFTLECEAGDYIGRQWSIDPEFDTGS